MVEYDHRDKTKEKPVERRDPSERVRPGDSLKWTENTLAPPKKSNLLSYDSTAEIWLAHEYKLSKIDDGYLKYFKKEKLFFYRTYMIFYNAINAITNTLQVYTYRLTSKLPKIV